MSDKRFKVVYKEKDLSGSKIIVDTVTGVNYLFSWQGYSGGVTPLLDTNGNPIITSID